MSMSEDGATTLSVRRGENRQQALNRSLAASLDDQCRRASVLGSLLGGSKDHAQQRDVAVRSIRWLFLSASQRPRVVWPKVRLRWSPS